MKIETSRVRECLKSFDFPTLFREHLGWDSCQSRVDVTVDGNTLQLTAVAQKRGFVAFTCSSIPDRATRLKVDRQVGKSCHEHFIVYADRSGGQQVWQWVRREPGKPVASRDHRFHIAQSGDPLIQRLEQIAVGLDEEERLGLTDVTSRTRAAFDVDRVTKKFYERFQAEHAAFLGLVQGIAVDGDLQWYTSLMLNRLMFVYFVQKKGFLDGDVDYLRNRLRMVQQARGADEFHSFYRYFLLRLFHDGLGKSPDARGLAPVMEQLLGKVPLLNGGFFEVHELEQRYSGIDIPDRAFEKLFDFFDQYSWHLDERPLRADNEINPDVVGYIFEKYVNQKQMGAYYTKEDITEYIAKNTVVPFLFNRAQEKCAVAFQPDGAVWRLLRDDPDRYIYPAVRHGVIRSDGTSVSEAELPEFVRVGMHDPKVRMHDERYNLQQALTDDPIRLVTETWREYVARRERCLNIRTQLGRGEVRSIDDLVTLNLDNWQFARDAIVNAEGPDLLRALWHAVEKVTVLDPTCGSGAFLFAALRILETLYSDCLERMRRFIQDLEPASHHPRQYSDFKNVLAQIGQHPNERYFILKSIVISNLFGVDIMEEAVEICKLRLFLKLIAQVERVEQVEPLPDIDFNIRSGNTLVGYATEKDARKAFTQNERGQGKLMLSDTAKAFSRFQESVELVDRAFQQFRAQQIVCGGRVTRADKIGLRRRIAALNAELDFLLAGEYGIDAADALRQGTWKASYRPFHWFIEFYGIMCQGGFDIIVGNPPYVEYDGKLQSQYTVRGYSTLNCANLHAFVAERCLSLASEIARIGLIVPLPSLNTSRMESLQRLVKPTLVNGRTLWVSAFDERPSNLFSGVDQRLVIELFGPLCASPDLVTTGINRWQSQCRNMLFPAIQYAVQSVATSGVTTSILKIKDSAIESTILSALYSNRPIDAYRSPTPTSQTVAYRTAGGRYWKIALDRPFDSESLSNKTAHLRELTGQQAAAILMSSTFWWYYSTHFDMYNLKDYMIFGLRFSNPAEHTLHELSRLGAELQESLRRNSVSQTITSRTRGRVTSRLYVGNRSKGSTSISVMVLMQR
jgi:hypothetical protein